MTKYEKLEIRSGNTWYVEKTKNVGLHKNINQEIGKHLPLPFLEIKVKTLQVLNSNQSPCLLGPYLTLHSAFFFFLRFPPHLLFVSEALQRAKKGVEGVGYSLLLRFHVNNPSRAKSDYHPQTPSSHSILPEINLFFSSPSHLFFNPCLRAV